MWSQHISLVFTQIHSVRHFFKYHKNLLLRHRKFHRERIQGKQSLTTSSRPSSSSHNDGHSLLPESTQKAFRQVTIPEFNWLRERQVQGSPRETLVGKACGCLQTPQTSSVLPAVQTIAAVDSAARPSMREGDAISTHLAPSQYQTELTHISRGNYGSTAVTSPPQSQATTYVAADLLAFMDPAERQLRMMSKRLGLASRILMDGGVVPVFNGSMTDFVGGGGRLGLVRALGSM